MVHDRMQPPNRITYRAPTPLFLGGFGAGTGDLYNLDEIPESF
jgi:hypothetical protein